MPALRLAALLLWAHLLLLGRCSAAAVSCAVEPKEEKPAPEDWRKNTLVYHIWPRAFQDSDGDGDGDLQGIINRLDYLVNIGVDTIRLSSIYSSLLKDSGYDILNHTDIDPIYGDFDDFDKLVDEVHKKDLKIILDIIPNHSSSQHEWFLSSATEKVPYDDYYIWADGKIEGNKLVPPNNWKSAYSNEEGSAWTWNMKRKQWYYHKFHSSEPDLNLRNEDVIEEILNIFDFWLEKGVDGFCICGVSYLYENEDLLDESSDEDRNMKNSDDNDSKNENKDGNDNDDANDDDDNDDAHEDYDDNDDSYTVGLTENVAFIHRISEHIGEWVKKNNGEPKLLLGEVDEQDDNIISYYGNETSSGITPLNLAFILKLNDSSDAGDIKDVVENWMKSIPEGAETNWMLSNQDNSRASSRLNSDRMDGLYMLTLLLPGQAVTYYGEEIGMLNNTNISWDDTIDIQGLEKDKETYDDYSRDPFRTPMQWDDTVSAGFSTNETTFLPVNPNYVEINVKKQLHDSDSDLQAYTKLSILRENRIFTHGTYDIDAVNDDKILILKRSLNNDTCLVLINFGCAKETVNLTALYPNLEEDLQVMVDSSNVDVEKENDEDDDNDIENDSFTLDVNAAVVLCDRDDFADFPSETTTIGEETTTDDDDSSDDNTSDSETTEPATTSSDNPESEEDDDPSSDADTSHSNNMQYPLQMIVIIQLALLLLLQKSTHV